MTLNDAKILLEKHRIPYQTAQYESEADYFRHLTPFPNLGNAKNCRVTALVIPSINGVKDIELQFNRKRGEYSFEELWFGGYGFEMYDDDPDFHAVDTLELIGHIVDGKAAFVIACDLKKKCMKWSCWFNLTSSDSVFGSPGYRDALKKIEAPKSLWKKLSGSSIQYDIYDWRTYRQVVK